MALLLANPMMEDLTESLERLRSAFIQLIGSKYPRICSHCRFLKRNPESRANVWRWERNSRCASWSAQLWWSRKQTGKRLRIGIHSTDGGEWSRYRSLEKDAPRGGRSCGCLEFKGLRQIYTPRCRLFLTNFLSDSVFHTTLSKGSSLAPQWRKSKAFQRCEQKSSCSSSLE